MLSDDYSAREILGNISAAQLNYQEWVNVGMALKSAGESCSLWDDWSRIDSARYHAGECERKWAGFTDKDRSVRMGTLISYAMSQGWKPSRRDGGYALSWDSVINNDEKIVDTNWLEVDELPPPPEPFDQAKEIKRYLNIMFSADEYVGFVTKSFEVKNDDGSTRNVPNKGRYDLTAGQIISKLDKYNGDVGAVMGDYDPKVGAWVRFNPLDGKGVKDANVTSYRYALIESDNMPVDKQFALIKELRLPCACVVYSGGKSVHALIRIDAADAQEYRKRVDELYQICQKNGMSPDTQNRNPSRLSRLPGFERNKKKQYIVAENIGEANWESWKDYIESVNDDLPDMENLAPALQNLPELAPELIEGVLRQGHKMLVSGASKAAKSYLLIELCIAIAEGKPWIGLKCAQGRVLYVNLELDRASCMHRFRDVYTALGLDARNANNIELWNLRGKSCPMDKLAPKLIRRAIKSRYTAIIIDPIYKVITGDENAADQMALFCNQFDKICTELGSAVIYCHHHSKGTQGQKRAMDRSSGSGVFARDPDALLDLIELEVPDQTRTQLEDRAVRELCEKHLDAHVGGWRELVSQDDMCSGAKMKMEAQKRLAQDQYARLLDEIAAAKLAGDNMTGWRIEGTLREFAPIKPIYMWFRYPIHLTDTDKILSDLKAGGEKKRGGSFADANAAKKKEAFENAKALENGFEALQQNGITTVTELMTYTGLSRNTVKNQIDNSLTLERDKKGKVTRIDNQNETVKVSPPP